MSTEDKKEPDWVGITLGTCLVLAIVGIGLAVGMQRGDSVGYSRGVSEATKKHQDKMYEYNFGRWQMNEKTGEKEFVYGLKK